MAGRGFGKTRSAAEFIRSEVEAGKAQYIALVGKTPADARDVMIEGESGLLSISPPQNKPLYEPSKRRLTWPNGAKALIYSSQEPDQLRGPQFDCFVAGTMILTEQGQRPIETICEGDSVLTRKGYRTVIATSNRLADVGKIRFSNGAELVATPQHPVLQLHGWTKIRELEKGAIVCAGTKILMATSSPIATGECTGNIGKSGKRQTGQYLKGIKSIIKTKISRIMPSRILRYCYLNSTNKSIKLNLLWSSVKYAVERLSGMFAVLLYANSVNGDGLKISGSQIEYAKFAGNPSIQESPNEAKGISVASVVSTWEDAGKARVYNLTVEGEHEYIANGIIVHNCAWGDEIRTWYYPQDCWDNLMFGLRIGQHPRVVATTTPMPIALIKKLLKSPDVVVTKGTTYENRDNLAPSFFSQIVSRYEGTRLGRQEIYAELLEDVPGALWRRENIIIKTAPDMRRVVVAIDPAVTSSEGADETGIVVAGVGVDGFYYVLADRSARLSPNDWARRAIQAYKDFKADRIIGEVNNGGEMIELTLRTVDKNIPYKAVHASRGKVVRAEPIAALYEQCVAVDTQVATEYGNRPIQNIHKGDYVWTRRGLRRVQWAGQTGITETLRLRTVNHCLDLTANHPVYVEGKGFIKALTLVPKRDIIKVCEIEKNTLVPIVEKPLQGITYDVGHVERANVGSHENHYAPSLSLMGNAIISNQMDIGVLDAIQGITYYIETFGKRLTGQFQRDVQSIISMVTPVITAYRIWLSWQLGYIKTYTILANLNPIVQNIKTVIGIRSGGGNVRHRNICVNNAQSPLLVHHCTNHASVLLPVIRNGGIESIEPGLKLPVYNLEVEDSPEYFANGILVHNCKVFHTQTFEALEDQLITWTPETGKSPDRLDALVWAMAELTEGKEVNIRWL